jgi:serine/threonine protein phosphatase PrpC
VTIQHLGDSRVYLFSQHDQKWHCLTRDHNYLEQLRESGELKQEKTMPVFMVHYYNTFVLILCMK